MKENVSSSLSLLVMSGRKSNKRKTVAATVIALCAWCCHFLASIVRRLKLKLRKKKKNMSRSMDWYVDMLANSATHTIVLKPSDSSSTWGNRLVLTANPQNVEHILKTRFDSYPKGPIFKHILGDLLGRGIFNSDGESWQLQHNISTYVFRTNSLRRSALSAATQVTQQRLITVLEDAAKTGNRIDLQRLLQNFSFHNICRVALGIELKDERLAEEFSRAFDIATEESARRASDGLWKLKRALRIGSEHRLRRALCTIDSFACHVIRLNRDRINTASDCTLIRKFMLSIPTDDRFLRDVIVNTVLAGRDTTASALTWFFWLLCTHPAVDAKIRAEIRAIVGSEKVTQFTYDEIRRMEYLAAALSEAMRLYPPVPFDSKEALHDDVLPDSTVVRKGDRVTYHAYAMARMPSLWGPDCREFKPERWLSADDGSFVGLGSFSFKYAVFHGGLRTCVGRDLAFFVMKYAVAAVMASSLSFLPAMDGQQSSLVHCLTARMHGGFPVYVCRAASFSSPSPCS